MKNLIAMLFISLMGFSCAKQDVGNVSFVIGGQAFTDGSTFTGGFALYGVSDSGQKLSIVTQDEQVLMDKEYELIKDRWQFIAIGWTGNDNGSGFEGDMKCAYVAQSLTLNEETLSIDVTVPNCQHPYFASKNFREDDQENGLISEVRLRSCVKTQEGHCHPTAVGPARSYRLIMPTPNTYDMNTKSFDEKLAINSNCYNGFVNEYVQTPARLPFITATQFGSMPLIVEAYDNENCTDAPEEAFYFPQGAKVLQAAVAASKQAGYNFLHHDDSHNYITLPSQVCQGDRLTREPFAQGDLAELPLTNLICSGAQFDAIATATTSPNHYFLLNQDIDGVSQSVGSFESVFDGNNHQISNATINAPLFATLDASGEIKDLKLHSIEVNAATNSVGALVGEIEGPGLAKVYNIEATNITVNADGYDYIGGIIGINGNQDATIHNIKLTNSIVSGRTDVGGIMGHYQVMNLSDEAMVSNLNVENSTISNSQNNLGGIIGHAKNLKASDLFISNSKIQRSEPLFEAVGGIIGHLEDSHVSFLKYYNQDPASEEQNIIVANRTDYVGGAIGHLTDSDLFSAHVKTKITSEGNLTQDIGGAIGFAKNTIGEPEMSLEGIYVEDSHIVGLIGSRVGGVIGHLLKDTTTNTVATFKNTFANINITGDIDPGDNANTVGGFVGAATNGHFLNCATEISLELNYQNLHDDARLGGFAGELYANNDVGINIIDSYAKGSIEANAEVLGGFVGILQRATGSPATINIDKSFAYTQLNTGSVSNVSGFEGASVELEINISLTVNDFLYLGVDANDNSQILTDDPSDAATMQIQSNYVNFDFNGYAGAWHFNTDTTPNLPEHRWLKSLRTLDEGVGSQKHPYVITTPEQFNAIGSSAGFLHHSHFVQEQDINFNGGYITPIGTATIPFAGSYRVYGNTRSLSNGIVDLTGLDNAGIFRVVDGAHIGGGCSHLAMNSDGSCQAPLGVLQVSGITIHGNSRRAALIGHAQSSAIKPLKVQHIHTLNNQLGANAANSIGNVIGFITGNSSSVHNIQNESDLHVMGATNELGGIIGRIGTNHANLHHFSKSVNKGTIFTDGGGVDIGGLVGTAANTNLSDLKNEGELEAANATRIGGIAGQTGAQNNIFLSKLSNTGKVIGYSRVGGLVGLIQNQAEGVNTNISNSYVSVDTEIASTITPAGGLVGEAYSGTPTYFHIETSYALIDQLNSSNHKGAMIGTCAAYVDCTTINTTAYVDSGPAVGDGNDGPNFFSDNPETMSDQTHFEALNWDFNTTWTMGPEGPELPIDHMNVLWEN